MYKINLVIIFLLGFFDFIKIKDKNKDKITIILLFWLVIVDGLRVKTGTDWNPYFKHFKYGLTEFEPLFNYMIFILKKINNNYNFILLVQAIILYFLGYYSIYKYSKRSIISIGVLYSMLVPYLGANRQLIALSICIFSIKFIYQEKIFKFCFFILIAFLFHKSAILFLLTYYLYYSKISINFYKIIIIIIISKISLSYLLNILPFIINLIYSNSLRIEYLDNYKFNNIIYILGILKKIICIIICIYFYYLNKNKNKNIIFNINGLVISLIIYIVFYGKLQIIVSRGDLYFGSVFLPIAIGQIFMNSKKIKNKVFIYIFFCVYSWFSLQKGINYYKDLFVPYKSLFYNQNLNRKMY